MSEDEKNAVRGSDSCKTDYMKIAQVLKVRTMLNKIEQKRIENCLKFSKKAKDTSNWLELSNLYTLQKLSTLETVIACSSESITYFLYEVKCLAKDDLLTSKDFPLLFEYVHKMEMKSNN